MSRADLESKDEQPKRKRRPKPELLLAPLEPQLLDDEDAGRLLGVSAALIEKHREKSGLPAHDMSCGDPAKRAKALWRFNPDELRAWWQRRGERP